MSISRSLTCVTLTGVAFLAVTGASGAAQAKQSDVVKMKVFATIQDRTTVEVGDPGSSVGDIIAGHGTLSLKSGGQVYGDWNWVGQTTRVDIPGGMRWNMSTQQYQFDDGEIYTQGLLELPAGSVSPTEDQVFVVTGGTGDYEGVRGSMKMVVKSDTKRVMKFRLLY